MNGTAIRVSFGGTDPDCTAGYEREFRERERAEFDVGRLDDGSAYPARRSWRNEF